MRKSPAPEYTEVVALEEQTKTSRVYSRAESAEFADNRISAILNGTVQELSRIASEKREFELSDTNAVKERTLLYLRACEEASSIPTFSGLARSFGMSTEALNKHLRLYPDSETSEWLRLAHDAFADALAEAATHGYTNTIFSIFALKARSGWRDSVSLEITPQSQPLGEDLAPEKLAEKYDFLPDE